MIITSRQNELIKSLKKLEDKKYRDQEKKFLLEGSKDILSALEGDAKIELILYEEESRDLNAFVLQYAEDKNIPIQKVSSSVLKYLSQTKTPQGVLALVAMKENSLSRLQPGNSLLVLDRIQDPGNLGTILRSASAFGYQDIVILKGSVDPYNDKALRATAGSLFSLNLYTEISKQDLFRLLSDFHLPLVISVVTGGEEGKDRQWLKEPMALVIGNEGQGVDPEIQAKGDYFLSIKMKKGTESLNAGVAASIIMYLTIK